MKRSGGVTFSAVLIFIGSAFQLLAGCVILLGFSLSGSTLTADKPRLVMYFAYGITAFFLGLACWGIATGVGLLRLRNWARISTLILAGFLLLGSLPGLLMVPFIPLQGVPDSRGHENVLVRVFVGIIYGLGCALSAWWIYFFNTKSVKTQFGWIPYPISTGVVSSVPSPDRMQTAPLISATGFPTSPQAAGAGPKRPVSITVVAILLLLGAVLTPMSLLVYQALSIPFPMLFLGFLIQGWTAGGVFLAVSVASAVAGIGLLKLKFWGRTLAICVFVFAVANCLGGLLHPAGMAGAVQMMSHMYDKMLPPQTVAGINAISSRFFPITLWAGLIIGAASALVEMWFVVTRKQAFLDANQARQPLS